MAKRVRPKRPKNWLQKNLPDRKILSENPLLRPFKDRFLSAELWRFNRRSVPVGVAIGFLTAIIVLVPGFQMFVAVLLCPLFRGNIPTAIIATFINTPITTPPLIYASWLLGLTILGKNNSVDSGVGDRLTDLSIADWWSWLVSAGQPMLIGLFAIAVVTAALGYLITSWLWSRWVFRKYKRRSKHYAAHGEDSD